jgi:hypothetical protein
MKIHLKISIKTIVVFIIFALLLVFITCYPVEPLKIGYWDRGIWDVDAWGN